MAGIRPFRSPHGGHEVTLDFPVGPSQAWDVGDPVYLLNEQLTISPADGTEVLVAEFAGFAAQPTMPGIAGTTTLAGNAVAAIENEFRSIILPVQGQTFITPNFWTAASATGRNIPLGSDIGGLFQLAQNTAAGGAPNEWGVEDSAATVDTHATCLVVGIYTDRGGATLATATDIAFTDNLIGPGEKIDADNTTTGVWVEFMMMGNTQLTGSALGTA